MDQSKTNLIFVFPFRVLIPKDGQHLVLFPPRLNLWRFHIYPKFCPRALVESVLLRKVGGTPKWITIRVVWKVWVRFPRILLARLFHRQVIIHTTVAWVLFKPSKKCHCSKTCNFLSCFLYYFFSLFLSNFSLTLVLILAFLVKVEFFGFLCCCVLLWCFFDRLWVDKNSRKQGLTSREYFQGSLEIQLEKAQK